jgi:hypothetical protein
MLLGAGVAHASDTSGDDGILSGTQLGISIESPVTISGNSLSVIGDSESSDAATAVSTDSAEPASPPVAVTSGDDGIGSGSQAIVDVSAPVTVSGNAVSVIGDSSSSGATTEVASGDAGGGADATTSGEDSIVGGTQGIVDVTAPVTIGGNAVSVVGDSSSEDAITTVESSGGSDGGSARTSGEDSILGGTQLLAGVDAPITVGGNAVSVIGDSSTDDATTVVHSGSGSAADAWTSGDDSILGGTQILPDLSLPVTIGGNAVSVIGDASTDGATTVVDPVDPADPVDPTDPVDPVDPVDPTDPTDPTTPGDGGDSGAAGPSAAVASDGVAATLAAASGGLASTGLDAGFWERLALFLLVTGAGLVAVRRFALRR